MRLLKRSTEIAPDAEETHMNYGIYLQKHQRAAEAITEFEIVIDLQPRNVDALYRLASIYAENGRIEDAISALKRVVVLYPGYESSEEHLRNLSRMAQ